MVICILGLRFYLKKRGNRGARWFWNRGWGTCCTLLLGLKNVSCRGCLLFWGFFVKKKGLLNSFDFLSYGSEWRKRKTKIVVDVSRRSSFERCSAWGGITCFEERFAWGGLGGRRKLCSLHLTYSLSFMTMDCMIKHTSKYFQGDAVFEKMGEE